MKKLSDVNQVMLDDIATYMVDEIREQVHCELAPCMPEEFLTRYLHLDPEFEELLSSEFNIDVGRWKAKIIGAWKEVKWQTYY